jgi:LDH2 family malate/lactate/ureidoglycolate dehydrogenase
MLALRPEAFVDPVKFDADLEAFLRRIRANRPRPGCPSVRVPGEHAAGAGPGQRIQVLDVLWDELMALKDVRGENGKTA